MTSPRFQPIRALLTAPMSDAAGRFVTFLAEHHILVTHIPLLSIHRTPCPDEVLARNWDWLFFTSRQGVQSFYAQYPDRFAHSRVAAVGTETAQMVASYGASVSFIPSVFHATALASEFLAAHACEHLRILWPCGNLADASPFDVLTGAGATIQPACVYQTLPCDLTAQALSQLQSPYDVVLFTSASAVARYAELVSVKPVKTACLGSKTAQRCQQHWGVCDILAEPFTLDGLASALANAYQ